MYLWLFQQKHRDQGTDAAGKKFDACQYDIIRNWCIVIHGKNLQGKHERTAECIQISALQTKGTSGHT
jgi:hypothetical protein